MGKKVFVVCPGCGKRREVYPQNLKKSGHLFCNGCATRQRYGKSYIGKVFGELTILSDAEAIIDKSRGFKISMVKCSCSCGNEIVINRRYLFSGDTKSCGCLHKKVAKFRIEEFNEKFRENLSKEEREQIRLSRSSKESKQWLKEVKSSNRCVICGSSQNLAAHHLESFKENPELRFSIENGACLCAKCHVEYHTKFLGGYHVPATIATFDQFMRLKNGENE